MDVYVEVTKHAIDRARQRFPELEDARSAIAEEVLAAVAAGRMATKQPRWCVRERRRRGRGEPWIRFVWNDERTRVYPIDRRQKSITVITVIRPQDGPADTTAA